jgi:hypothetical protein
MSIQPPAIEPNMQVEKINIQNKKLLGIKIKR